MAHVLPSESPSPTYTAAAADETMGQPIVLVAHDDLRPDDIVLKSGGRQADTNVSYRAILEEWREIYEMAGQLEKGKIAAVVLREMATKGLRFLVPYCDRHPSSRRTMMTDAKPIYQVIPADSFENRKRMKRHLRKSVTQYYQRLNLSKQQLAQRHALLKATLKATRVKKQAATSTPWQSGMMMHEAKKPAEEEAKSGLPAAAAAAAQDDSSAWSSIWETSEEDSEETTYGSVEDQGSDRMVMPSGTCLVAAPGIGPWPISSLTTTTTISPLLFRQPEAHHGTTATMEGRGIFQGPEAQGMGLFKGGTALERFPESHVVAAAIQKGLRQGDEPFVPGGGASIDGAVAMDLFFKGTHDTGGEVNAGAAASSLRLQGPVMATEAAVTLMMMSQEEAGIENLVIDDSIFENDDDEEEEETETTTTARPPRAVCPCPQHGSPAQAGNNVVAAGLQRHQQQLRQQQQVVPRFSYQLLQRNHYRHHGAAETQLMHDDGVDDVVMRARAALRSAAMVHMMPRVMAGDPLEPISMVYDEDVQGEGEGDNPRDRGSARRPSPHEETFKNLNKKQG